MFSEYNFEIMEVFVWHLLKHQKSPKRTNLCLIHTTTCRRENWTVYTKWMNLFLLDIYLPLFCSTNSLCSLFQTLENQDFWIPWKQKCGTVLFFLARLLAIHYVDLIALRSLFNTFLPFKIYFLRFLSILLDNVILSH